jgi:hypothetical protein
MASHNDFSSTIPVSLCNVKTMVSLYVLFAMVHCRCIVAALKQCANYWQLAIGLASDCYGTIRLAAQYPSACFHSRRSRLCMHKQYRQDRFVRVCHLTLTVRTTCRDLAYNPRLVGAIPENITSLHSLKELYANGHVCGRLY